MIMRTGDKVLISQDLVFTKLFEEAEIAKFTPTELKEYEDSLKAYRDVKNSIDTALEKGREEGMAERYGNRYRKRHSERNGKRKASHSSPPSVNGPL